MIKLPRPDLAWRPTRNVVYGILAVLFFAGLLLWHLGSAPAGLSPDELSTANESSLSKIYAFPLFAPWRLLQTFLLNFNDHSIFLIRLPSVLFALLSLAAFYYVLVGWFGKPIAFLSTTLLGLTPLYLLAGRAGTPVIMYLFVTWLTAAYIFFTRNAETKPILSLTLLTLALVATIYVPGGLWFVGLALVLKFRTLSRAWSAGRFNTAALTLFSLILLTPLALAIVKNPHIIRTMFLIPATFGGIVMVLKNWLWAIAAIFIQAKQHESLMIGRLPVLDVAQTGLVLFGGYIMFSRLRRHFFLVIGLTAFIALIAALNNYGNLLVMCLPLLGVLAGMGLRYLYIEWVHVFPRNPIPRYFAISLMALVVLVHVFYGLRYGLVAWPSSVATEHLYMLKLNW